MHDRVFEKQMAGYGLTTAHLLYRLPDHPKILQSYIWQEYDLAPAFPELKRFIAFWQREIEGALVHVEVAHRDMIGAPTVRRVDGLLSLH